MTGGRVSPKADLVEIINSEQFRRMVGGIVKSCIRREIGEVRKLTSHLAHHLEQDPRTKLALELLKSGAQFPRVVVIWCSGSAMRS